MSDLDPTKPLGSSQQDDLDDDIDENELLPLGEPDGELESRIQLGEPKPAPAPAADDLEPISLEAADETVEPEDQTVSSMRSYGTGLAQAVERIEFVRPMNSTGLGATRCRIFHAKIAEASLKVMESHINEWIDGDQIEVKHVGQVTGIMQGKSPDPNVIVLVWY